MIIDRMGFVQRFNEEPLLLAPRAAAHIEHLLVDSQRARDDEVPFDEMCAAAYGFSVTDRSKPFVFSDGLAFIPVQGLLLHKYNYSWEGATGYEYIRSRFDAALADPDVQGIVFDVNSPGGQVAGNFELAQHIAANRDKKPTLALVDNAAYSAAYSLGSACGRMVATPSGGAGSIGVVLMHVSVKRMYESIGIDVSLIFAGKHKVDSSPYAELSDEAKTRFQAAVDRSYDQFVSVVASNRKMDEKDVRKTEALTYDAAEAKRIGLIDDVQEPQAALAAFRRGLSGATGGNATSDITDQEAADSASVETETNEGNTMTDTNQRERISAILKCEEATGRRALAEHFAFNTDMSVDDAKAALAVAAQDQPAAAAPDNAFARAMATGNPDMDAGGDASGGDKASESPGQRIARTYAAGKKS